MPAKFSAIMLILLFVDSMQTTRHRTIPIQDHYPSIHGTFI